MAGFGMLEGPAAAGVACIGKSSKEGVELEVRGTGVVGGFVGGRSFAGCWRRTRGRGRGRGHERGRTVSDGTVGGAGA